MKIAVLVLSGFALVIFSAFYFLVYASPPTSVAPEHMACMQDSDCTLIYTGCDCFGGNGDSAVSKKHSHLYAQHSFCTQKQQGRCVISMGFSPPKKPICEEKFCKDVPQNTP